jgi:two-component system, sensor histidine kinase and response regulator
LQPTSDKIAVVEEDEADQQLKGLRVLLVEDNAVNQKLASHFLNSFGCEFALARDGQEAVDLAELNQFDLILMDCHMPRMDGYAATAQIRRSAGINARTPVLALTANTAQEDITRCLDSGMNAWMSKPIRRDELAGCCSNYTLRQSSLC